MADDLGKRPAPLRPGHPAWSSLQRAALVAAAVIVVVGIAAPVGSGTRGAPTRVRALLRT